MIISGLFADVRTMLRDDNANKYGNPLMTPLYNRAVYECWALLTAIGAEVAMSTGTIATDGAAQSYDLPAAFRAFAPRAVLPRSPITATSAYTHGRWLDQIGSNDARMQTTPAAGTSARLFAVTVSGTTQALRFNTIPAAGEYYDYWYYPAITPVAAANVATTETPWMGLLDQLLARVLEEFAREGLEFVTTKRDMWRARAEADVVQLLGLRHLLEINHEPSMWKGFPI